MIKIEKHSGIYTLTAYQELPITLDEAWEFFSSPRNLAKITPPYMGFKITSSNLQKMYAGQIITYKIAAIPGMFSNWVTEITHVNSPHYFVDEQRSGPYSIWHHEHIFEKTKDGISMLDRVSFQIPYGILGHLLFHLFIGKQVKNIFNYRYSKLETLFQK